MIVERIFILFSQARANYTRVFLDLGLNPSAGVPRQAMPRWQCPAFRRWSGSDCAPGREPACSGLQSGWWSSTGAPAVKHGGASHSRPHSAPSDQHRDTGQGETADDVAPGTSQGAAPPDDTQGATIQDAPPLPNPNTDAAPPASRRARANTPTPPTPTPVATQLTQRAHHPARVRRRGPTNNTRTPETHTPAPENPEIRHPIPPMITLSPPHTPRVVHSRSPTHYSPSSTAH